MNKELLHKDGTPMRKYSSPLINELNEEIMNDKLDGLSELITRIDAKILDINNKLDAVIKALHEYDDDQLEWPEPNDVLKEAAFQYNELVANKRMDIIGQNGNEGIHYVTNEEADDDARSNNNPANTRVDKNNVGRNKGKKRKSAIEEHIKYPPHKH
jgi:hypothetical protein